MLAFSFISWACYRPALDKSADRHLEMQVSLKAIEDRLAGIEGNLKGEERIEKGGDWLGALMRANKE